MEKGPFGVAQKAKQYNLPVIGIAGKVPLVQGNNLQEYFDVLLPINNEAVDLSIAMQYTYEKPGTYCKIIGGFAGYEKQHQVSAIVMVYKD
jgi:glycerate kinase